MKKDEWLPLAGGAAAVTGVLFGGFYYQGTRTDSLATELNRRMDSLNVRMDGLDSRIDGLDSRLTRLEARFDERTSVIDHRLTRIEDRLDKLITDATTPIAVGGQGD